MTGLLLCISSESAFLFHIFSSLTSCPNCYHRECLEGRLLIEIFCDVKELLAGILNPEIVDCLGDESGELLGDYTEN